MEAMEQRVVEVRAAEAATATAGVAGSTPSTPVANDEGLPDLILIDLNLPRVSGLELLKLFRASKALEGVRMVVLSGSDAPSDRDASLKLGAMLYLRKPGDLAAFDRVGQVIVGLLGP
jgi:DNA-binding response OmpR family regulator